VSTLDGGMMFHMAQDLTALSMNSATVRNDDVFLKGILASALVRSFILLLP
jgi:hypothetical protein